MQVPPEIATSAGLAKFVTFLKLFLLKSNISINILYGKSQLSTIFTGFLIEVCLLMNIRDKNTKKK